MNFIYSLRLFFKIFKYLHLSSIPSINIKFPVPLTAIHSHTMTDLRPCFTVWCKCRISNSVFGFFHTQFWPSEPKMLNFDSSEKMTLSQKELSLLIYFCKSQSFFYFFLFFIFIYCINIWLLSRYSAMKIIVS